MNNNNQQSNYKKKKIPFPLFLVCASATYTWTANPYGKL